MRVRPALVAASSAAALVVGATAATADQIANDLDGTVDSAVEVMPLVAGGTTGSAVLRVVTTGNDGKPGCNLTGSTTLTVSVASTHPGVATVSPSSVTFSSCGDTKTLTVTPLTVGTTAVSLGQTANTSGGSFDLAPATFQVDVTPPTPTNTPPSVEVGGVAMGGAYALGTVPPAFCSVTDAEDGASSFPAVLTAVTGPHAADGIGQQTASCSYTDAGGLTAASSATYSVVDPSAPAISYVLAPSVPDGDDGWYRGDVALDWTVSEPESPSSLVTSGCVDTSVTEDQPATDYTCSAGSAGGAAGPETVTIKRDATAPSVTAGTPSGTAGAGGWFTSAVTVPFTALDATSGPASRTASVTSVGEGPAVQVPSPAFSDVAGNTAPAGTASPSFAVDLTDPTASFDSDLGSVYYGSVPTAPTCTASDDVSGPAGCTVTGYSADVGTHTLTATATDVAGRTGTSTQTYTVLPWTLGGFHPPVDMGGVFNTVRNGSTVPLKFEVFRGSTELTDTAVVKSFTVTGVTCASGALTDDIELTTTGGTSLRYDATGGQFVQNWQTPKKPGVCYRVTMTTQDGSSLAAYFKLK